MAFRREPSKLLNQVYFQNESFIIERGGQPLAAVVPLAEYLKFQHEKQHNRLTIQAFNHELQAAFAGLNESEIASQVGQAVDAVRGQAHPAEV